MKPLSECLNDRLIKDLGQTIEQNRFPGITLSTAMTFALTDGMIPEAGLPVDSFLKLETWLREHGAPNPLSYTATELKNKTGVIIESVMRGNEVTIRRHGRPVAVIRPASKP